MTRWADFLEVAVLTTQEEYEDVVTSINALTEGIAELERRWFPDHIIICLARERRGELRAEAAEWLAFRRAE